MTTQHEQSATLEAKNWLSSLPRDIQLKTLSTQILKEHWTTKNSSALSSALVDCFKQKAWEKVAYMPSIKSKREIREYTRAIEWIRDCLGVEPDELMRTLTGYQSSVKEASEAVTLLVELIANEEPSTLDQLCNDYKFGKSKMIGWEKLLDLMKDIDPAWCKANDRLKELINSEKNYSINSISNPKELIEIKSPDQFNNKVLPLDSRSRLIRTLTKLKERPLLCKSRGTTIERVSETLNKLLRGLIPSVQEAKREAGLLSKTKSYKAIGISGNPKTIAKKIIKTIGKNSANQIANQILEALKNDR